MPTGVVPDPASTVALASSDTGMAVAWTGDVDGVDEVFQLGLDASGAALGDALQVSPGDGAASWAPALEVAGDGWAVAWVDARYVDGLDGYAYPQAYVRIVSAGEAGPETRLPDAYTATQVYWSVDLARGPDGLGAAWHDAHDVFFAAVGDDGSRETAVTQLTNDPWTLEPLDFAWGGGAFSAVWTDERNYGVYYGRVTRAGVKEVPPLLLRSGETSASSPSLCWDGDAFAVLWIDTAAGTRDLTLVRVAPDGTTLAGPVSIEASRDPTLARVTCTGEDYGVTWLEAGVLSFMTVGEDLESVSPGIALTGESEVVTSFATVWRGESYVVAAVEEPVLATPTITIRAIDCTD